MGRPKGGTNRYWSKESKYEVIKNYEEGMTWEEIILKYQISDWQLGLWLRRYHEKGIEGLENKRKPGNPLAALHTSKSLSEIDKLKLENMRLKIENERLKKGYTREDVIKAKKKSSD